MQIRLDPQAARVYNPVRTAQWQQARSRIREAMPPCMPPVQMMALQRAVCWAFGPLVFGLC
jgi:hypothetical protein